MVTDCGGLAAGILIGTGCGTGAKEIAGATGAEHPYPTGAPYPPHPQSKGSA